MSNNVTVAEFCGGIILGVAVSSLIALAIIWVPIVNKLRRKVNKLIDDIGVNL
jgi:ABC-type nitrate/sulfonate/bicarbonate transport system permease component